MPGLHTTRRHSITALDRRGGRVGMGARVRRLLPRTALALCGLVALLLSACAGGPGSVPLAKNQLLVWPYRPFAPVDNKITHDAVLDPAALSFANDTANIGMLYAPLVSFDASLNPAPDAATWDVSNGGTIYTFHLKHNLKFSDGTPLTAADYAYSIDRALAPNLCTVLDANTYGPNATGLCPGAGASPPVGFGLASGYLNAMIGVGDRESGAISSDIGQGADPKRGIDVIDPYTLQIRLSTPAAYFIEAMTYPVTYPVEKSLVDQYPGGLWVDHLDKGGCSGPFMVKSYDNGKTLEMVPNPYWEAAWNTQLKLSEVDRPYVGTIDDEYAGYRAGQYDYSEVPGDQYTFARGEDDFNEVPTLATQYFGMNTLLPPFDNPQVRQALDLALNKQYLVDNEDHGAEIPSNHIVPRGMPGFDPLLHNPPPDNTQSLTGNQSAATTLLKQAQSKCPASSATPGTTGTTGTSGTTTPSPFDYCPYIMGTSPLPIVFYAGSSNQTRVNILKDAVAQWKQVLGLNIVATVNDNVWAKCVNSTNTTCQAWAVGWLADYPDPQDFLSLQFATNAPDNTSGYSNSAEDAKFAAADKEQNATARMADYNTIEQDMVNACVWIPYAQDKLYWRQRNWVHGFGLNALQEIIDVDWAKVYITAH